MHTKSVCKDNNKYKNTTVETGRENCIIKYLEVERTADSQNVLRSSMENFHLYLKEHLFFGQYGFGWLQHVFHWSFASVKYQGPLHFLLQETLNLFSSLKYFYTLLTLEDSLLLVDDCAVPHMQSNVPSELWMKNKLFSSTSRIRMVLQLGHFNLGVM